MARMPKGSLNQNEGCPDRPPRPTVHSMLMFGASSPFRLFLPSCVWFYLAGDGSTMSANAQAKAAISRAIATVMTFIGLPAACRRR